ncbi:hypothetical protein ElyMa_003955900 [Elysia marginata]|uniref:Uncharacterized protein n=1 Tax=Elysia marginata TaxID=1093978 RepID=A0AAV4FXB8_9GAST|nr:hypothetical protein ElyMa_003955900 [Elysia marginata]
MISTVSAITDLITYIPGSDNRRKLTTGLDLGAPELDPGEPCQVMVGLEGGWSRADRTPGRVMRLSWELIGDTPGAADRMVVVNNTCWGPYVLGSVQR